MARVQTRAWCMRASTLERPMSASTSTTCANAAGLKFLCFRQNLIADASVISQAACKRTLEELFINDNKLRDIPDLAGFDKLSKVEFSYNHEVRMLAYAVSLQIDVLHLLRESAMCP